MGYGVQFPLRFTARGGLATTQDNLTNLIALSLLPGLSGNPYNARDGVGSRSFAWEPASLENEAAMLQRIEDRFAELEQQGRARLRRAWVRQPIGADRGVWEVVIDWLNLETGASDQTVLPSQT